MHPCFITTPYVHFRIGCVRYDSMQWTTRLSVYLLVCCRYVDFLPAISIAKDSKLEVATATCLTNENTMLLSCAGEIRCAQAYSSILSPLGYHKLLRWRVSKLIFARVQNDHFQYGELQSLTVANGHLNVLYLVKGMCQPSFVRW